MNDFLRINGAKILLILIFPLALFFRLYGLDWDQGHHLHPDERFLTMVVSAMKIPKNLTDYLNPKISTMNPYNVGYQFFVYGTFPLNLTKIVGVITKNDSYSNINIVGRILSSLFDVGVVFLLFEIGKKIFNEKTGLLSAFLYTIMVLPIQLSHFFAVDTFLNFFIVLSFYFLIPFMSNQKSFFTVAIQGIIFGLAFACKISAILFIPIILLGGFFSILVTKDKKYYFLSGLLFLICAYTSFRFNNIHAFAEANILNPTLNEQFVKNFRELKALSINDPDTFFPPAIQWLSTKPMISPFKNLILWGLGLPLGIVSLLAILYSIHNVLKYFFFSKWGIFKIYGNQEFYKKHVYLFLNILIIAWVSGLFIYQGVQFGKPFRYFLPIYPFLALLSSKFLLEISTILSKKLNQVFGLLCIVFYALLLIYPLAFMSIYTHSHSRVAASEWIYENIPPGSTLSYEHWDDGLPVSINNKNNSVYSFEELPLFAPDNQEKWRIINERIRKVDYMVLSSNRLWGSISKLPKKYPIASKFYKDLMAEKLNFKKIAEFSSYPCFPPIGKSLFCFPDQSAEESFTVYDHPMVIIFKKINE